MIPGAMDLERAKGIAALAFAQADMAQVAPSHGARVVQDYTSLDNLWSALLVLKNTEPPKNHARKLALVEKAFPELASLRTRGLGVRDLYRQWLFLRYDGMDLSPGTAIDLHLLGENLWGTATNQLATLLNVAPDRLKRECHAGFALADDSLPVRRAATLRQGIVDGFVRDLGAHMGENSEERDKTLAATCPATYIEAGVFSDRPEVRANLSKDPRFADWIARLYQEFYELVLLKSVQLKSTGVNDDWALSVSLAFHGPPAVRIVLGVLEESGQRNPAVAHKD